MDIFKPLQLARGTQGASRVALGKSSLLSSCEGERGIALESLQGNQVSFAWKEGSQSVSQVVAGSVGFLELRRGPVGASHVVSGKSGILSSCEEPLRIPFELVQGTRASS